MLIDVDINWPGVETWAWDRFLGLRLSMDPFSEWPVVVSMTQHELFVEYGATLTDDSTIEERIEVLKHAREAVWELDKMA